MGDSEIKVSSPIGSNTIFHFVGAAASTHETNNGPITLVHWAFAHQKGSQPLTSRMVGSGSNSNKTTLAYDEDRVAKSGVSRILNMFSIRESHRTRVSHVVGGSLIAQQALSALQERLRQTYGKQVGLIELELEERDDKSDLMVLAHVCGLESSDVESNLEFVDYLQRVVDEITRPDESIEIVVEVIPL